jgi:hypothetical protein
MCLDVIKRLIFLLEIHYVLSKMETIFVYERSHAMRFVLEFKVPMFIRMFLNLNILCNVNDLHNIVVTTTTTRFMVIKTVFSLTPCIYQNDKRKAINFT